MPIRTNRGRAAVYRRVWGTPMRSPKHLAVTLVVLTLLLVTGGIVLPRLFDGSAGNGVMSQDGGYSSQHDTPVAHSRDLDERETAPPAAPQRQLEAPESVEPAPRALTVAHDWAEAWVDHPEETSKKEWLAALEPYTTREFLPQLKHIRLGNIPSSEVTGAPEPVSSHRKSLVVKLPTDGPVLLITVIDSDEGWRVSRYEQAG